MSELKPCPFCSGESIVVKTAKCGRYIVCWDCGCRTEDFETDYAGTARDKAVAAWNRRAQPANEPLTIDELREMDGEPVFVASPGVEEYGHWGIVCGVDDTAGRTLYLRGDYSCHDYGKTWLAYRRPPERSENDA